MATNFPSNLDNFTNPTSGDTLDSPDHAAQHADVNDAVEAIETALLDGAPLHIDDVNERVGIGTTTPNYPIDVAGDINLSGDIRVNGVAQMLGMQRLDVRSFTSSGNYLMPADAKIIYIQMWSGGGGGASGESDDMSTGSFGTSGYGGFFESGFFAVHNAGYSTPVVVGSGGAGGIAISGGAGGDGLSFGNASGASGYSSFGDYLQTLAPTGSYGGSRNIPYYGHQNGKTYSTSSYLNNNIHWPTAGGVGGYAYWGSPYATTAQSAPKVFAPGTDPVGNLYNINSPNPAPLYLTTGGAATTPVSANYEYGSSGNNGQDGYYTYVDGTPWYLFSGAGGSGGNGATAYYIQAMYGGYVNSYGGHGGNGGFPAGGGGGGGGAAANYGAGKTALAGFGGNGGNGLVQFMVFG